MSNIVNFNARLVRLEARRRGQRRTAAPRRGRAPPDRGANGTHGLEEIRGPGGDRGGAPERRPVTIIDLNRRLAGSSSAGPPEPDPRAEEARERALTASSASCPARSGASRRTTRWATPWSSTTATSIAACMALIERRGAHQ